MLFVLEIIQSISCVIALGANMFLMLGKNSRKRLLLIMTLTCSLVQCMGYMLEINAQTAREAMYAVRMEYLGSTYITLFLFLFACELCHINVKKWLKVSWFLVQSLLFFCIMSTDWHGLYYSSYTLVQEGLYPHLVLEPGPLYWVFMAGQIMCTSSIFFITIRNYFRMGKEYRGQTLMVIIATTIPTVAIIAYLLGFTGNYDPMSVAMLLALGVIVVSVRKYSLLDLQEQAQTLVMETVSDAFIILDPECGFIEANNIAQKVFPFLQNKVNGEKINVGDGILYQLLKDEAFVEYRHDDKIYEKVLHTIMDGRLASGSLLVLRDVTESRNHMDKLIELRNTAEQANHAKSSFLANMSHEIRTPMNAILGMNEIMMRSGLSGENLQYAQDIESSGKALLSIINDILDLSKIESGRVELVEGEYEIASVLHDLVTMFSIRIMDKPMEFKVDFDESMPKCLIGDELRIRQVLINIIGNAIKYTKKGSVNFKVSWEKKGNQAVLCFSVKDTGIGIKEDDLKKIFNSFQQLDTRKNRAIEGTGLGLSIAKGMVELMGGTIQVESIYGKGSDFTFWIPQKVMDWEPMGKLNYEHKQREITSYGFIAPEAKVLLVDDNQVNLRVAMGLMAPYRMQIDTAESGMECMKKMKAKKYDLIFMDHMMPDLDGIDTLKMIREEDNEYFKKVPVVALTANAVRGIKEFFETEGFQGYISKPIQVDKMETCLMEKLPKEKIVLVDDKTEKKLKFAKESKDKFVKILKFIQDGENDKSGKALLGMAKTAENISEERLAEDLRKFAENCQDAELRRTAEESLLEVCERLMPK